MKKKVGIIRQISCIGLVFLLNINSFAAIVSDNDGSAFITKSEFDALKSSFQSQIDTYNKSIDSKIDGAIASYLSGIKLSTVPINEWENFINGYGSDFWFANNVSNTSGNSYSTTTGDASFTSSLDLIGLRHYTYKYSKVGWHTGAYNVGNWGITTGPTDRVGNGPEKGLGYINWQWGPNTGGGVLGGNNWNYAQGGDFHWVDDPQTKTILNTIATSQAGSGKVWVYHKLPNGTKELREYANTIYPKQNITAEFHTYNDFVLGSTSGTGAGSTFSNWKTWYINDNKMGDNTNGDFQIDAMVDWGTKISPNDSSLGYTDSMISGNNTTRLLRYYRLEQALVKQINPFDYSSIQFGAGSTTQVYCINDLVKPSVASNFTDATVAATSFPGIYYQGNGGNLATHELSGYTVKYKQLVLNPEHLKLSNFTNSTLGAFAGETVHLGGGVPLFSINEDRDILKIDIDFKCVDSATMNAASSNVKFKISDGQFKECNFDISNGKKQIGNSEYTWTGTPLHIELTDINKGKYWINLSSTTDGYFATINSITIS